MAQKRNARVAALILLAGVVFLALGGVIGAIFDEAPRQTTTTTAPPSDVTTTTLLPLEELDDAGVELDQLIAAGRTVDIHAVYSVTDPDLPTDLVQTLVVWRKGDEYRSDIVERAGDAVRRVSTIVTPTSMTRCETVDGEQTCRVTTVAPQDLPAAFVRSLVTNGPLNDPDEPQVPADPYPTLTVAEGDVAGFIARCFSYADGDETGELCLAEDGLLLSVKLEGAEILATTIEDRVPDTAFDHPGVVRDDETPTTERRPR
jgi:hypothetical protein